MLVFIGPSDAAIERLKKLEAIASRRHGSIVAWLVWAPVGDEHEYYVFTDRVDAYDKRAEFDERDPDNEHAIEALVCHPTFDYRACK